MAVGISQDNFSARPPARVATREWGVIHRRAAASAAVFVRHERGRGARKSASVRLPGQRAAARSSVSCSAASGRRVISTSKVRPPNTPARQR